MDGTAFGSENGTATDDRPPSHPSQTFVHGHDGAFRGPRTVRPSLLRILSITSAERAVSPSPSLPRRPASNDAEIFGSRKQRGHCTIRGRERGEAGWQFNRIGFGSKFSQLTQGVKFKKLQKLAQKRSWNYPSTLNSIEFPPGLRYVRVCVCVWEGG